MPDDMYFTQDKRSLRRGRRVAQRSAIFRPCVVWLKDLPDIRHNGVVLDINSYGIRIRMVDMIPPESQVVVQLMRDEDFEVPLGRPIDAVVVRVQEVDGLSDHGIRVADRREVVRQTKPAVPEKSPAPVARESHMFMLDMIRRRGRRHSER